MTVIAWDGKTLAADKRATDQYGRKWAVTKIGRANGCLFAMSGDEVIGRELYIWWVGGAAPSNFPASARDDKSSLIVINPAGDVMVYTKGPFAQQPGFNSWGSGGEFASMAMHLGKTAPEAVELACQFSAWCGDGVDTLEFD